MEFRCRLASPNGRSSRASIPPTARRGCATSSRRRACSSCPCSKRAPSAACRFSCRSRSAFRLVSFSSSTRNWPRCSRRACRWSSRSDLLKRRVETPLFRTVLDDVHEKVRSGTALSDAFAAHGDRFPRVYTASLLAGERSGNLDAVLRRYVEYAKVIATVKQQDAVGAGLSGHPRDARPRPGVASSS